jgi:catechol 2,3-dioxygenase-like lactoylglutathione lyase family enzyme
MKVFGLQLNVWDFDAAIAFYCDALGFEIENETFLPEILHIKKDDFRIIFYKVEKTSSMDEIPRFVLNIETDFLSRDVERLKNMGIRFVMEDIQYCPVADYIEIVDPFKNVIDLVQLR